jgi:acyl CoA:acetate/3-ketoacid CoA transferase beta subunit
MLITDLCVMEFDDKAHRFVLTELAPGVTVEDVKGKSKAEFVVAPNVKTVSV